MSKIKSAPKKRPPRRRVRDFLDDVDYLQKLSPAERKWLYETYVNPVLGNDLRNIPSPDRRREYRRADKAFYGDLMSCGRRVPTSVPHDTPEALLLAAQAVPDEPTPAPYQPPAERAYRGSRKSSFLDYQPSLSSPETAILEALFDHEESSDD